MSQKKIDIRKFRSDISTLKKKGLLSGVDARSAVPDRRLTYALKKYDAVLSGKASAVKLSKSGIDQYKALGKPYDIASPKGLPRRVIVPHEPGERVTVSHGKVSIANPAGVHRTVIPVKYHSLPQFFKDIKKKPPTLKEGEYFAFRFFGNRSHKVFRSMDALVNSLEHYESIFDSIDENDAEQMAELYQNLEIIRIESPVDWKSNPIRPRQTFLGSQRKSAYEKRKAKLEKGPEWKQDQQRKANADRQKAYRARLKGKDLSDYQKQGRKRAAKSAKKAKKEKRKRKK